MGAVRAAVGFAGMWVVVLVVSAVIGLAILGVYVSVDEPTKSPKRQGEALPYDPNPVHQR